MGWAYAVMCLIYGTTFLAIRAGDMAGMPPLLFAALRFSAAGILTLLVVVGRDRSALPTSARAYLGLASVGLFNTTAVFSIVYIVEQYVPSSYAALLSATMPLLVMLLGGISNKQTITHLQYIGLILGFFGVFAIAWPGFQTGVPHWIASTVALVAAQVMAAIGSLQSRKILAQGMSPFVVNGFQVLFGGLGLFVLAAMTGTLSLSGVHDWREGLVALAYLTVFGSMVAASIFFWLVKRASALLASTWTYVSPIIAIGVGSLWFHEPVYWLTGLGTVGILGGVFLVNLQAFRTVYRTRLHRRQHVVETVEQE